MNKYIVAYNETHQKVFLVRADSPDEALDMVEDYPEDASILDSSDSVLATEPRVSWFVGPFNVDETFKTSTLNILHEVLEVFAENLLDQSDIAQTINDFLNQQEDMYD